MFNKDALVNELTFKAVRSSGSGGQHVNKVASKVELSFNLNASTALNNTQKIKLQKRLKNRLTKENILLLQCGESRSQHNNKNIVTKRFLELITLALREEKKRIPTKIPRSVIKKRLKNKRYLSDKKSNRQKPNID